MPFLIQCEDAPLFTKDIFWQQNLQLMASQMLRQTKVGVRCSSMKQVLAVLCWQKTFHEDTLGCLEEEEPLEVSNLLPSNCPLQDCPSHPAGESMTMLAVDAPHLHCQFLLFFLNLKMEIMASWNTYCEPSKKPIFSLAQKPETPQNMCGSCLPPILHKNWLLLKQFSSSIARKSCEGGLLGFGRSSS